MQKLASVQLLIQKRKISLIHLWCFLALSLSRRLLENAYLIMSLPCFKSFTVLQCVGSQVQICWLNTQAFHSVNSACLSIFTSCRSWLKLLGAAIATACLLPEHTAPCGPLLLTHVYAWFLSSSECPSSSSSFKVYLKHSLGGTTFYTPSNAKSTSFWYSYSLSHMKLSCLTL